MKTPEERNRERLLHISTAIAKIESYIKDLPETEFYNDSRTNEAVLFQLSIIGEAVVHIDSGILGRYEYPWHQVSALRNVIAHQYFGIQLDKVWSILRDDLPGLKNVIAGILQSEF